MPGTRGRKNTTSDKVADKEQPVFRSQQQQQHDDRMLPTTLRLDFDDKWSNDKIEQLEKRVSFVSDVSGIPLELEQIWPSQNGGAHVILTAWRRGQQLHAIEVCLLQCLLGSDLNRELNNYQRALVLAAAPDFWRLDNRWNTHYREKLESRT